MKEERIWHSSNNALFPPQGSKINVRKASRCRITMGSRWPLLLLTSLLIGLVLGRYLALLRCSLSSNQLTVQELLEPGYKAWPKLRTDSLLLVAVMSATSHVSQRMAIRSSWYSRSDVEIIFFVGSTGDDVRDRALVAEAKEFDDLVVANVIDTYNNLSLKVISVFQWIKENRPHVSHVLKADDDVFVQIPRLKLMVQGLRRRPSSKIIYGNIVTDWHPVRNRESKYFISRSQYEAETYPPFATGPSYLISRDALESILDVAFEAAHVHLEDVFITGILSEKADVKRELVLEFRNNAVRIPPQFIGCTLMRTVTIHKVLPSEHSVYTKMARRPQCGPQPRQP